LKILPRLCRGLFISIGECLANPVIIQSPAGDSENRRNEGALAPFVKALENKKKFWNCATNE
jgi:hypothetical protein